MSELKPCPFCGGRAAWKQGIYTGYVMCLKCEVMGPNIIRDEAITAWNRRPSTETPGEWRLVPVEPTREMVLAGAKCLPGSGVAGRAHRVWDAMLSAIPVGVGGEGVRASCTDSSDAPRFAAAEDAQRVPVKGERYDQARALVIAEQNASVSFVQRRLQCGYNEAASYIERMQAEGVVSAPREKPGTPYPPYKRDVLVAASDSQRKSEGGGS